MNEKRLQQFVEQVIADLGGAFSLGLVRIGTALGLYRVLHERGPVTSVDLARATGLAERYVREWLSHHAASGYVTYDPQTRRFALPPEQAAVFADEDSPFYLADAFECAAAYVENQPKVQAAFKNGGGVGWGDQSGCLFCAVARFFRPGYQSNILQSWLPALDGVVEKLERGARVADIGCGHGYSTVMMAEAFPNSQFVGFDFHTASIEEARHHAQEHGVTANVSFDARSAKDFPGHDYDLVTCLDAVS
jgi:hypothetical protein